MIDSQKIFALSESEKAISNMAEVYAEAVFISGSEVNKHDRGFFSHAFVDPHLQSLTTPIKVNEDADAIVIVQPSGKITDAVKQRRLTLNPFKPKESPEQAKRNTPRQKSRFVHHFKESDKSKNRIPDTQAYNVTPQDNDERVEKEFRGKRRSIISMGRNGLSVKPAKTTVTAGRDNITGATDIPENPKDIAFEYKSDMIESKPVNEPNMLVAGEEEYKSSWETLLETIGDPVINGMDSADYEEHLKLTSKKFLRMDGALTRMKDLKSGWEIKENPLEAEEMDNDPLTRQWNALYNCLGGENYFDINSRSRSYYVTKKIDWNTFEEKFMSTSISMHQYSEASRQAVADFQGGILKGTLLSYVCLRKPPTSVIQMLIKASPETLIKANKDSFTPLSYIFDQLMHHFEVMGNDTSSGDADLVWDSIMTLLELIQDYDQYISELFQMTYGENENTLIHHLMLKDSIPLFVVKGFLKAYPHSVLLRNTNGATALHLAAQRNIPHDIVSALLKGDKGKIPLILTDADGCTPLHLACIHGVAIDILNSANGDISRFIIELLLREDMKKEAVNIKDNLSRTPLIHAITKGLSSEVVSMLLESSSEETVEKLLRIIIGLPLRERRKRGGGFQFRDTNSSKSGSSHDIVFEAQIQDVSLRYFSCLAKEISTNRRYQMLLNSRASDRIFTALMMLDFYVYTLLIIGFTCLSDTAFRSWSGSPNHIDSPWDNILYTLCFYLFVREAIQAKNEGMNWLVDPWNWLDMANIVLVVMSVTLMRSDSESMTTRYIVMITGAIVWTMMLSFLRLTFLPFSVFVNGVINILWRLIPFVISSFIVLGAFVHLYYIDSIGTDRCHITVLNDEFGRRYKGEDSKFCTYPGTFVKIYSMFVGGLDEYLFTNGGVEERNWRIADHDMKYSTLCISVFFGLLVQILLLNVIIVIVNESWDDVSRHGSEVFWENRLNVLLEVKSFANWNIKLGSEGQRRFIKRWLSPLVGKFCNFNFEISGTIDTTNQQANGDLFVYMLSSQHNGFAMNAWKDWNTVQSKYFFGRLRKQFFLALKIICQFFVFIFLIAASIVGGLLTLGVLWPRSIRYFIFGSNEMDHNEVPGEMSREVRNLFKQNENYDSMLNESKKLHEMLHEKDAALSLLSMQLLQQQEERMEFLEYESNSKAIAEGIKQQYEESIRRHEETSSRLESKLTELLELMVIEKTYS